MNISKIIFLFFIIIKCQLAYSINWDTTSFNKQLKLLLFSDFDLKLLSEAALEDYYNRKLDVKILKSKGFNDFVFYEVGEQILAIDSSQKDKTIRISTPTCLTNDCKYILAFNKVNKRFYKLKGIKNIDFIRFYNLLERSGFWIEPKKINKKFIRRFLSEFYIENLDLECLLKSLKGETGACLKIYENPTLIFK